MRPKIDRDVLGGERELFAGQSLKLVASVVAEPPAKVSFVSPSGAILEASDCVTVKEVIDCDFIDSKVSALLVELGYKFEG